MSTQLIPTLSLTKYTCTVQQNTDYCCLVSAVATYMYNVCTYIVHTYIHTHIHTYTHTYIHTYIHTHTYIHIHTYIHTYTVHTYNLIIHYTKIISLTRSISSAIFICSGMCDCQMALRRRWSGCRNSMAIMILRCMASSKS